MIYSFVHSFIPSFIHSCLTCIIIVQSTQQVYDADSANAAQLAVLEDASARVRQSDTSLNDIGVTFNADWMLLVTWEEVPAYRAQFTGSKVSIVVIKGRFFPPKLLLLATKWVKNDAFAGDQGITHIVVKKDRSSLYNYHGTGVTPTLNGELPY